MKQKCLLLDDIEGGSRKGEVISVNQGFFRNWLFPKGLAIPANPHTLRMQVKLQEERAKKAVVDRKDAEELAIKLQGMTLTASVKVDPEGNMYGSVSAFDIVKLFEDQGYTLLPRHIALTKPIKKIGVYSMTLKLNEGVACDYTLQIVADTDQPQ